MRQQPVGSPQWIAIRNQIVEGWLRYAGWAARHHGSYRLDFEDNLQIAALALLYATEQWSQEGTFSSYVRRAMQNALWRASTDQGAAVRVPYDVAYKARQSGQTALPGQLSGESLQSCQHAWRRAVSLDQPIDREDPESEPLHSQIEQTTFPAPDADVLRWDDQRLVARMLAKLTTDERTVVRLHFGLSDGIEHSFAEIAYILNLSVVKARRLGEQAIRTLRANWSFAPINEPQVKNLYASAIFKLRRSALADNR
jgi:RNA polymerase nonessential primary-like sigma factor